MHPCFGCWEGTYVGSPCKPSTEQHHLGIATKMRATSSLLLVT